MAHELSEVSGRTEMFVAGTPAWHRLGTVVPKALPSHEAIRVAGLDWEVEQSPIQLPDGTEVPDRVANIRRAPNGSPVYLGTVGKRYSPIQNRDAFSFVDGLVEGGDVVFESAGAIRDGKRVWMLGRLPGDITLPGVNGKLDAVIPYLLFFNPHDGSGVGRCLLTPTRVVCQNTLTYALNSGKGEGIAVRHSGNIGDKLSEARRVMGLVTESYRAVSTKWHQLIATKADRKMVAGYFDTLFPLAEEHTKRQADAHERVQNALHINHNRGMGAELARGTLWGAYNAVTEYVDHTDFERRQANAEKRFERVLIGGGAVLKAKALQLAVALADA